MPSAIFSYVTQARNGYFSNITHTHFFALNNNTFSAQSNHFLLTNTCHTQKYQGFALILIKVIAK